MIRRPPRSTLSSSSAASDVYKRQVEVRDDHRLALHAHDRGRDLAQMLEQRIGKEPARKGEMLELLRIGEAADAIAQEHEMVLAEHPGARDALGMAEAVLNDLEDDVERR